MLALLALTAALAHLTAAQVVSVSSLGTTSTHLIGETITDSSGTHTITPIGPILPTLTGLSTLTNITNHIGPTHTVPLTVISSASDSACQTVTAAGEPVYTIQTDTNLPVGCTVTVYSSSATPRGNGTVPLTTLSPTASNSGVGTQSTTPATTTSGGTAASQTTNAAATGVVGKEGLGLAALGAAVLLL